MNKHPAVAEGAAFGIIDPVMGEEMGVAIVLYPGYKVTPEEVITWCESKLSKFMMPRYIEFMEKLPKSASEKVQKGCSQRAWINPQHMG